MITLQLVYLARLRDAFGIAREPLELDVPNTSAPTVADVLSLLRARGGVFSEELAPGRAFRVAVNFEVSSAHDIVNDGNEVAIFPPVTGG